MISSRTAIAAVGGLALAFATAAIANPMVGGAAMYSSRNIVQNAVNSKDHTTLVAAVKAGGLVDTLSGKGPFTVFAPTNAAFAKLPAGTVGHARQAREQGDVRQDPDLSRRPRAHYGAADRDNGRRARWHCDAQDGGR